MTAYNVINAASMAAGQPEDVSVVLANLQAIAAIINGSLDDSNLSPSAALTASKIAGYPSDVAKVLKGDGTWGTIAAAATTGYGTALPGSPTDGREYILVDSLTAPTYQWHFRYNAGATGPYKWEYIGGTPAYSAVATSEAVGTASAWVNLATQGPLFTLPRAGDYEVEAWAYGSIAAAPSEVRMGVSDNGDQTPAPYATFSASNAWTTALAYAQLKLGRAANDVLKMRYFGTNAGNALASRLLRVRPLRVA
jgi:hypothetical protein